MHLLTRTEAVLMATMATTTHPLLFKRFQEVEFQPRNIGLLRAQVVSRQVMETTVVQIRLWKCLT